MYRLSFQFLMAFAGPGLGSNQKELRRENCLLFFGPLKMKTQPVAFRLEKNTPFLHRLTSETFSTHFVYSTITIE